MASGPAFPTAILNVEKSWNLAVAWRLQATELLSNELSLTVPENAPCFPAPYALAALFLPGVPPTPILLNALASLFWPSPCFCASLP